MMKLAYLCDVFGKLNDLNVQLQGRDKHIRGTVAQCVALLPHSKKVMGSSPAWCNMSGLVPGPFCVEFACSPRVTRVPPVEPQQ